MGTSLLLFASKELIPFVMVQFDEDVHLGQCHTEQRGRNLLEMLIGIGRVFSEGHDGLPTLGELYQCGHHQELQFTSFTPRQSAKSLQPFVDVSSTPDPLVKVFATRSQQVIVGESL